MRGNGTARNGIFQPAQKAVHVLNFNLGLGTVAKLQIPRTFDSPDQHAALGIAERGNCLAQIAPVVRMQRTHRLSVRNSLFKVQKQLFRLPAHNKLVNGIFAEINQFFKNIFRSGHCSAPVSELPLPGVPRRLLLAAFCRTIGPNWRQYPAGSIRLFPAI